MKSLRISLLWLVFAMSPATGLTQVMEGLTPVIDSRTSVSIWNDAMLEGLLNAVTPQGSGTSGVSPFSGSLGGQSSSFPFLSIDEVIAQMPAKNSTIPSVLDDLTSLLPSGGAAAPTTWGSSLPPWTGFYIGEGAYGQSGNQGSQTFPFIMYSPSDMPSLLPGATGSIPSVLDDVTSLLPSRATTTQQGGAGANTMGVQTDSSFEMYGGVSVWRWSGP